MTLIQLILAQLEIDTYKHSFDSSIVLSEGLFNQPLYGGWCKVFRLSGPVEGRKEKPLFQGTA